MKLTILSENTAGGNFLAEHGLSYLIEHKGEKLLFDSGHSNLFLKNATKLGINLQEEIDTIVLSHGHWDHGGGLGYLNNMKLITHPSSFMKRFRKSNHTSIGLELSEEEIQAKFHLIKRTTPYLITPDIIFLGAIPRLNDFEAQTTTFIDENGIDDFVPDDSAIVINDNEQLIIISGCAHSGICNIVEYSKKVTGINNVEAVIGGFHLKENNMQTQKTIKYFQQNNVRNLYPSHCTELPALAAFAEVFEIKQLKTGVNINI